MTSAAPAPEQPAERTADKPLTRLAVKTGSRVQFVRVDDIDWIEACANYARLHIGNDSHLFRASMSGLENRLDRSRFVRVHRSTIVNVDRISSLLPSFGRDHILVLRDGTRLKLSATHRAGLAAVVDGL